MLTMKQTGLFLLFIVAVFSISIWLFHKDSLDLKTVCKNHGGIHQVLNPQETDVLCNDGTVVRS